MPFRIATLLSAFLILVQLTTAQVQLTVTINSGSSTSTCVDGTFGGGPELHWSAEIAGQPEVVYPMNASMCFQDPPNIQYSESFNCPSDYPNFLTVCLNAFEDDGASCIVVSECLESNCSNFVTPSVGSSVTYNTSVSGTSTATMNFTIAATGSYPPGTAYDQVCNAINLGTIPSGGSLGDNTLSNYANFCATNAGDPNPWGGDNDQGVWFQFTTSSMPSSGILVDARNDPANIGNDIDLQLALYSSSNGACTGTLSLLDESYLGLSLVPDEQMNVTCLEAFTTYFLLVDGQATAVTAPNGDEGYFGLEITDDGVQDPGGACGPLPVTLLDFSTEILENVIVSRWRTATEVNNSHFIMRKSTNGASFERMGRIAGAGNSSEEKSYEFVDSQPSPGLNYYELTQVDWDGTIHELGVNVVDFKQTPELRIVPNPVVKHASVVFSSPSVSSARIRVVSISGNILNDETVRTSAGMNQYELPSELAPGVYILMVQNQGNTQRLRFTVR